MNEKRWSIGSIPSLASTTVALALSLTLCLAVAGCNLNASAQDVATATPNAGAGAATATSGLGTVVAATSSVLTSTPQTQNGNNLPVGTLILLQVGKPIAQLPGTGSQTIALPVERFGSQASPDARYGIRVTRSGNTASLALVNFSDPSQPVKDIPQGAGLSGPGFTWKANSSGFAFFDFPTTGVTSPISGVMYYDVASGQTKQLVPAPQAGQVAAPRAFSPDGKHLFYAVGSANSEGVGGPDSKPYVLDTTTNQSMPLPAEANGFSQWLRDNNSFLVVRNDASGASQVVVYTLSDLQHPKVITPANTADFFVGISPDGKHIAVTTTPTGKSNQVPNIAIMNLDGSSRKQLTKFTTVDQTITALVWGNDGIYYSLSGSNNTGDATWRMDLDGSNATQVAQGTLSSIIGAQ